MRTISAACCIALLVLGTAWGSICGDGVVSQGEGCDDGNTVSNDGCSDSCSFEGCSVTGTWAADSWTWTLSENEAGAISGHVVVGGSTSILQFTGYRSGAVVTLSLFGYLPSLTMSTCDELPISSTPGVFYLQRARSTICGDGIVQAPEEACDDGNIVNGDSCTVACALAACGNGVLEPGEQCDDSNAVDGDGCATSCLSNICGNGVVEPGEQCDDGNVIDGDGCSGVRCEVNACGNGILEPGEQCDDNNIINGDLCSALCAFEGCPLTGTWHTDGPSAFIWSLVEDATGGFIGSVVIGQGGIAYSVVGHRVGTSVALIFADAIEWTGTMMSCDELPIGVRTRTTYCGDGILQPEVEACDDGNFDSTDACTAACMAPTGCGNAVVDADEECDDGNGDNNDACLTSCRRNSCGDGFVNLADEACDDGNTVAGDGCDCTTIEPETVFSSVGGALLTVTTDTEGDGATSSDPVETTLRAPFLTVSGAFSIREDHVPAESQAGFVFMGTTVRVSMHHLVPPPTEAAPLSLIFELDATLIAPGQDHVTIQPRKDGTLVAECADGAGAASPDPCVSSRERLGDGDVRLVILTSTLSDWDFYTSLCGGIPALGCQPTRARSSSLKLKEREARDVVAWKWRSGKATPMSLFGDPSSENDWALCVYDADGRAGQFSVPAGGICAGGACWESDANGFRYTDRRRSHDGVGRLTLRSGAAGRGKITFSAKGDLRLPDLPLTVPTTIQLRSRDGACFEARFTSAGGSDPTFFKGRSD